MKKTILFPGLILITSIFCSCKKKKLNESLFEDSKTSTLSFYQNKDTILTAAGSSPHGAFKLKFNSISVSQFGSDGKIPLGGSFSKGSLIVKEVFVGGQVSLYAVMKKDESKFSSNGWLWGEYGPDGKVIYSVGEKGKSCVSCHQSGINRDLTKSFDLH